ncbi:saccharopine dehydrogenase NADP-binding domain-containing protein [Aquiluna borgnonia]|uniref:Saccharopine dehydrogenase NADP-binding domain-containing protein n=1 Tax=Aquiluna borgnonia TaxID=2499157 RepID=A0A7D4QMC4_9MICO|nr:saccharopine dehydrogenase C-terminal domain-containing protein [Aquiluna borgnonia]QKJ24907.1 saccharopine dehydrogenase NADP-binding domain-containing protein [Aquiluna borgnonia]
MRILLVGAGGVGDSIVKIAANRNFYELIVVADYDPARAQRSVDWVTDNRRDVAHRFIATSIDASNSQNVAALVAEHKITHVMNAVEPKFVQSVFQGALDGGANYLDMAMSLSHTHPTDPFNTPAEKLGDWQYDRSSEFATKNLLALIGTGAEPGISNIFARYAADHLFQEIDEIKILDGGNLVVKNDAGEEIFAPSFSIWTVIEECLNPPLIWEKDRGWFTTPPFSEPEVFEFPEGIGAVECVNVEHEEVNMLPRTMKANRVSFKYGLGTEFINVLQTLHALGLDRIEPVSVRSQAGRVSVAPRDVVAAVLPDPASLASRMTGKTCAGTLVTGTGTDGSPRATYLYHVADTEWTNEHYGSQAVVWQTALVPVISLELLASGTWSGTGVMGPEEFDAKPFLDLLRDDYGQPWGLDDRDPQNPGKL